MPLFFRKPKPPSAAQLKAQFISSILEWDREFSCSMQEQRQEYLDEEREQSGGEKTRKAGFDGMMYQLDQQFTVKAEGRDQAFQEAQKKQDDIFRDNEAPREKQFSKGEADRSAMFHQEQGMRRKMSEWYASIRRSHVAQGNLEREKMCKQLEDDLMEQFESLLRFEEESFASAERRRNETVSSILTGSTRAGEVLDNTFAQKPENGGDAYSQPISNIPTANFGATGVVVQPLVQIPDCYSTDHSTVSSSRSASPASFPREASPTRIFLPSVSPPLPDGLHIGRCMNSESSTITQEVDSPLPNKASKVNSNGRIFEGVFETIQTRYQEEFRSEEAQRDARFNEAESARDYADSERNRLFYQHESTRSAEFTQMMALRWQQFDTQESSRQAREGWRKERFDGGMKRRSWLFEQAQVQEDEKMYSVLNSVEEGFLQAMKDRIKKLVKTQQQLFDEARDRRSIAFTQSQIQRETELGTPGEATIISGKIQFEGIHLDQRPVLDSAIPLPTPSPSRTVYSFSDTDSTRLSCGRTRSRSPYRDQSYFPLVAPPMIPLHQSQSWYTYSPLGPPLFGFHHSSTSINDTLEELNRQEPDVFETKSFNDEHLTRQLFFSMSEAERRRQFEDGMYRRQCTFVIHERIRNENFESEQRNKTNMSFSAEKERDISFLKSQQERECQFQANEAIRASTFYEEEAQRVAADLEAQKRRGELYHLLHDKLQKQCLKDEARRSSGFEAWALALLRERKQKQVDGYKGEERVREEKFVRSLDSRNSGR